MAEIDNQRIEQRMAQRPWFDRPGNRAVRGAVERGDNLTRMFAGLRRERLYRTRSPGEAKGNSHLHDVAVVGIVNFGDDFVGARLRDEERLLSGQHRLDWHVDIAQQLYPFVAGLFL